MSEFTFENKRLGLIDVENLISEYMEYVFEGDDASMYIYRPSRDSFGRWKYIAKYFSNILVDAMIDDELYDLYIEYGWANAHDAIGDALLGDIMCRMDEEVAWMKELLLSVNRQEVLALTSKLEVLMDSLSSFSDQMSSVDIKNLISDANRIAQKDTADIAKVVLDNNK